MNRVRQRIVLCTGLLLAILYALLRCFPNLLPSGAGFSAAIALILFATIGGAYCTLRSKQFFRLSALTLLAAAVALGILAFPNFCRVAKQHQLESVGATLAFDIDDGDGVWFRWQGVYLPVWSKTILGEAFFGRITEIDLSNREFSVDELCQIELRDTLTLINLANSDITNTDLDRICDRFDSTSLHLNSTRLDNKSLGSFTKMKSLVHASVIDTKVSQDAAQQFVRAKATKIRSIVVGDYSNYVQAK